MRVTVSCEYMRLCQCGMPVCLSVEWTRSTKKESPVEFQYIRWQATELLHSYVRYLYIRITESI